VLLAELELVATISLTCIPIKQPTMKKILFTLALLISFSSFGQLSKPYIEVKIPESADKYEKLNAYNKAIENYPDRGYLYSKRGHIKWQLFNDLEAALVDYNMAVKLADDDKSILNVLQQLGSINSQLGNYYDAIYAYTRAIEAWDAYADCYFGRGNVKLIMGDLNGACKDWKKAVEVAEPNDSASQAFAYVAQEQIDKNCN